MIMKKIKKFLKSKYKILLVFIIGAIIFGGGMYAATLFNSDQVLYNGTTTVKDALDDLYDKQLKSYTFNNLDVSNHGDCSTWKDGTWTAIVPQYKADRNGTESGGETCAFVATLPTSINVDTLQYCNVRLDGFMDKTLSSSDSGELFRLQNSTTAYPFYSFSMYVVSVRDFTLSGAGTAWVPFNSVNDLSFNAYMTGDTTFTQNSSSTSDTSYMLSGCQAIRNKVYLYVTHFCTDAGTDGCSSTYGWYTRASSFKMSGEIVYNEAESDSDAPPVINPEY